jgi:AcrR family transcriptional regulator
MADDSLPEPLATLWGRRPVPRRGPRPGLTVEQIVAAAMALADAEGIDGVSMSRVAERLEVTTMALYRYVSSKAELLALMADAAIGSAEPIQDLPQDGSAWREALERWCRVQLDLVRVHPWVIGLVSSSPAVGPNRLWWLETGLRALAGTPLTMGERTEVIGRLSLNLLSEASLLSAIEEMDRRARQQDGAPGPTPDRAADAAPHPALIDYSGVLRLVTDPAIHPETVAALEAGAFDTDPDDEYDTDFGLRLMLDGVAALIERASRR